MDSVLLPRRVAHVIKLGSLALGGDTPVRVQSMTNTDTRDTEATLLQIQRLAHAGCELVRVAVPDAEAGQAITRIQALSPLPLIADIHFDYRLALLAIEGGCAGLRINPGNLARPIHVHKVVDAAKAQGVVIRVGVNAGSLPKDILKQFGGATPEAMVESALRHIRLLEQRGFEAIKVSIKSSSVLHTIKAYRLLASSCEYPLHLGVTEAGSLVRGAVKSTLGIGMLLAEGIGDTLRVSLAADPVEEMPVAWEILRGLGLRHRGPEVIACPTCGRTEIDLLQLVDAVERHVVGVPEPLKIAVMGCVVNGPGEAREADIGLAGGRDKGVIFVKGDIVRTVRGQEALLAAFLEAFDRLLCERRE